MLKNLFLTIMGFIFLTLGAIGVFLPIWPTTPFVLLAVASFSVNPAIYRRIMKINFINAHVTNYKNRSGLKKSTTVFSIVLLWVSMFISILASKMQWVSVILIITGLAVTVHILWISGPKNNKRN